jgi:methylated-DNA-[protein]-cysteine S-methyltransferase
MISIWYYEYPVGIIGIGTADDAVVSIFFGNKEMAAGEQLKQTPLQKTAAEEIAEYFAGRRKQFNVPIRLNGTPFQKAVWNALLTIPFGETRSYTDIARQIGNEKAVRAVGMANNRNKISIIVPCHRVIGRNGDLVGYASGLTIKKQLLDIEKFTRFIVQN